MIAEKIEEGVKLFDPGVDTGFLTDWCQDGIDDTLTVLYYRDSRGTRLHLQILTAAQLGDALEKTAYFTLDCKSLTVGTDHQPFINGTDIDHQNISAMVLFFFVKVFHHKHQLF